MFQKLTNFELVFITLMAACGLAIKPVIGPVGKLLQAIFFIPGGSVLGALYMIWPMLALLVVGKFGAASLVGLIQGIILFITGFYGSHGILTLITYFIPCILIDICYLSVKHLKNRLAFFFPTALGNISGSFLVGYFIMHLPFLPVLFGIVPAFIFGGIGGLLAAKLHLILMNSFPHLYIKSQNKKGSV